MGAGLEVSFDGAQFDTFDMDLHYKEGTHSC